MGTSKSYRARVKGQPQWGDLSSSVTRSCTTGEIAERNIGSILSKFVNVVGGASNAGRGKSKIAGQGGARSAQKLGSFLGGFSSSGGDLTQALADTGLTDLTGKSAEDIINHLIDYCSGSARSIDDKAAKEATRKLLEKIAEDAKTPDELEEALKATLEESSLEEVVIDYFGHYVFEHLSVMFYEKLVEEKGKAECSNLFGQIKKFIDNRLTKMNKTNPLNKVDWGSSDGERIIFNIQEDVLKVFGDDD
ncbi:MULTISPECIES: hypothetical protein [Roseivirga]|uniref:Uncharacterized protein n=1 Tax=Roseivirga seohaensis TaxID=1914963 RepID=A0A150XYZ7_9BACT|nr:MULTISPECIES: hypothetical protein [Roseivirga]KYG83938.1 hypothetical protein AWW67_02130 [Roseivirga seohaensis]MEC7754545.1 hypothetical protein [Bacteroidota bacterium]|tara:strand:+ start:10956 stop:11702 length:747 start_codon:yes stop_codon:yes gene_type:complete